MGVKGTVPLSFIPREYGGWSFHAGFRYMNFEDKNLQGMQVFNAPGQSRKGYHANLLRVYRLLLIRDDMHQRPQLKLYD